MTALRAYVHAEIPDLLDAGIDETLDRLSGELGVDGLSASAVAAPLNVLRVRPMTPRTLRCEAAAHFQIESRRYADTRVRPIMAGYLKSKNPLELIRAACTRRNMALRLRINVCDSPTLAERFEFAACKDAFGERSPARICPANPDVRVMLRAIVEDLSANYTPDAIDIANAGFGAAADFHPSRTVPFDPAAWQDAATCFCESCRQSATRHGIDAGPIAEAAANDAAEIPIEYTRLRVETVAETLAFGRAAATSEYSVVTDDSRDDPLLCDETVRRAAGARLHIAAVRAGDAPDSTTTPCHRIGLDAPWPGGAALVKRVADDARRGLHVVMFEAFAQMSDDRLDTIRQGLRLARRDVAGAAN